MPVYWNYDDISLPLPDWVQAAALHGFDTRMAQMVLLLRPDGLVRLRALLAQTPDQILMVPGHVGWQLMRITSDIDVLAKPGGWLRVRFDVAFDETHLALQDQAKPALYGDSVHVLASATANHCTVDSARRTAPA